MTSQLSQEKQVANTPSSQLSQSIQSTAAATNCQQQQQLPTRRSNCMPNPMATKSTGDANLDRTGAIQSEIEEVNQVIATYRDVISSQQKMLQQQVDLSSIFRSVKNDDASNIDSGDEFEEGTVARWKGQAEQRLKSSIDNQRYHEKKIKKLRGRVSRLQAKIERLGAELAWLENPPSQSEMDRSLAALRSKLGVTTDSIANDEDDDDTAEQDAKEAAAMAKYNAGERKTRPTMRREREMVLAYMLQNTDKTLTKITTELFAADGLMRPLGIKYSSGRTLAHNLKEEHGIVLKDGMAGRASFDSAQMEELQEAIDSNPSKNTKAISRMVYLAAREEETSTLTEFNELQIRNKIARMRGEKENPKCAGGCGKHDVSCEGMCSPCWNFANDLKSRANIPKEATAIGIMLIRSGKYNNSDRTVMAEMINTILREKTDVEYDVTPQIFGEIKRWFYRHYEDEKPSSEEQKENASKVKSLGATMQKKKRKKARTAW